MKVKYTKDEMIKRILKRHELIDLYIESVRDEYESFSLNTGESFNEWDDEQIKEFLEMQNVCLTGLQMAEEILKDMYMVL